MCRARRRGLIFGLRAGSSFFPNMKLQPHDIEQTTQFIDSDVLFPAFDAIELLAAQSRPGREFLLRHAEPATTRRQRVIDVLFHAHSVQ